MGIENNGLMTNLSAENWIPPAARNPAPVRESNPESCQEPISLRFFGHAHIPAYYTYSGGNCNVKKSRFGV